MPSFVARFGCYLGIRSWAWVLTMFLVIAVSGCSKSSGEASATETDARDGASMVHDDQDEHPHQVTDVSEPDTESSSAAPQSKPASEADLKKQLQDAATQLWDARVKEDWPVIFSYQQFRNAEDVTVEEFVTWSKQNEPFVMRSYSLNEFVVDGDVGWVSLTYESSMRQFPDIRPNSSDRDELWQIVDGHWKLVPSTAYELYPQSPTKRDAEAELVLRQVFDESWQARIDADWEKLYQMADPRDHNKIPQHEYAEAKSLAIYLDRDVEWVQVIGDTGVIRVAIKHKLNDPNLTKLPARFVVKNEQWIRLDGKWYLDLRPEVAN